MLKHIGKLLLFVCKLTVVLGLLVPIVIISVAYTSSTLTQEEFWGLGLGAAFVYVIFIGIVLFVRWVAKRNFISNEDVSAILEQRKANATALGLTEAQFSRASWYSLGMFLVGLGVLYGIAVSLPREMFLDSEGGLYPKSKIFFACIVVSLAFIAKHLSTALVRQQDMRKGSDHR